MNNFYIVTNKVVAIVPTFNELGDNLRFRDKWLTHNNFFFLALKSTTRSYYRVVIYLSLCSRSTNPPSELAGIFSYLEDWPEHHETQVAIGIARDSDSIYEGHKKNIGYFNPNDRLSDDDIIVFMHDDVEIISTPSEFTRGLKHCLKPGVGFIGVAGTTHLTDRATWWEGRSNGETRGFVFQGPDNDTMAPNAFGPCGQVVVMDGCFLAATWKTVKKLGMDKPKYLTSDWDFYDLHMTFKAYMEGLTNYVVPIVIRHVSSGEMRQQWYTSRQEFAKEHRKWLPCKVPLNTTLGLPV